MLTLRGHHLLCLPKFQGQGYNAAFTENMAVIQKSIIGNSEQRVCVVDYCDDICTHCPHHHQQRCVLNNNDPEIIARDRRVLSLLGIEVGAILSYCQLQQKLAVALSNLSLAVICGDCGWSSLCFSFTEAEKPQPSAK